MNYVLSPDNAKTREIFGQKVVGDPKAVEAFEKLSAFVQEKYGLKMTLTGDKMAGLRSAEDQLHLSKTSRWGNTYSKHMAGLAFDVALHGPSGRLVPAEFNRQMQSLYNDGVLAEFGFGTWGGTFKEYDPIHIAYDTPNIIKRDPVVTSSTTSPIVDSMIVEDTSTFDPNKPFLQNLQCAGQSINKLHATIAKLDSFQLRNKLKSGKLAGVVASSEIHKSTQSLQKYGIASVTEYGSKQ